MVTQKDILTRINELLVVKFPDYEVYIQRCPKDFKRPSFLLEYVKIDSKDINRTTVEKTVYLTITCFVTVDKYSRADPDQLAELQELVIDLFSKGYIAVGDRALKGQGSTGGLDFDKAFIDLQFKYFDTRLEQRPDDSLPLMESLKFKF